MMRALTAWSEFLHLRAIPVVLGAAAAFLWVAARSVLPASTALFLISILLTQVAIAFHNNWCDRDLDAVTKPWRLIPRGALAPRTAHRIAWLLFAAGVAVSLPLGPFAVIAIMLGTACGFGYDAGLKRTVWSFVPYTVALPTLPVAAFIAAGRTDALLAVAYLVGAPLVIAIHLADALPDVARDRAFGLTTLAVRLGCPRDADHLLARRRQRRRARSRVLAAARAPRHPLRRLRRPARGRGRRRAVATRPSGARADGRGRPRLGLAARPGGMSVWR